jgi:hypothetical protein
MLLQALFSADLCRGLGAVPHLFTRKTPSRPAATCRYFALISVGEDARNPIVAYGAPAISGSLAASHCAGADAGLGDAITGFTLFGAGQDAGSFVHAGSRSLVSMSNS